MAKDKDDKDKRRPQRREPKLISNDKDDLDRYADEEDYEEEEIEQAPRKPRASKKKPKAKKKQSSAKRIIWFCLWRFILLIILIISAGLGYICHDLPDIGTFGEVKKVPSIIVKADDGTVIGTYGDVYGDYVPYAQIPKSVVNAVVATEDRNFFSHFGIDPRGFARAMYVNIKAKRMVQGGSTITQQLAKNLFLTSERKLKRKLQEMILALELEKKFSKEEIMTIYLNRVYMGAGNFGVDAAARRYFGHSVREVSLSESAILIGLLKAPSRYAPTGNPDLSEKRATQVLFNMKDAGYLTDKQVEEAKANFNDEDSNYRDSHGFGSFYFSDWVVGQLPALIGDVKEDIVVSTTLKTAWQSSGEDAVNEIALNEIIWKSIKGENSMMPPPVRSAFVKYHADKEEDDD
ncbi:MAG: transglycosylase domain-containing protein [Pseudomonadota bacterium]